ncbi:MAG: hypothetical protein P4L79_10445 [Legionella sp.]|uniref:hypothetical protein n=1 Tax=Legionella sp. TaxID=459 RepID=UPI00284CB482|nr:hypothetical protein [Legionella sp.]
MKIHLRTKTNSSRRSTITDTKNNENFFGKEPVFGEGHLLTNSEWQDSLTWYTYVRDLNDARTYLNEYYDCNEDNEMLNLLKTIHDDFIPTTAAWNSRLILNGYNLPDSVTKIIDKRVYDAAVSSSRLEKDTQENKVVISLHDRFNRRLGEMIGDLEKIIDDEDWTFSLYNFLQKKGILSQYSIKIVEYYKPYLQELKEAYLGQDPDLKEAYRHLCRAELKNRINFFTKFIADGERHANVTKKVRKPRKLKPVTPERLLKTFNYQKELTEYNLKSCDPKRLIGAQEVWLFNSKYKTITVLKAAEKSGMTVKGTTIIGFDEKTSITKRAGRHTGNMLAVVASGGKIDLRKVMPEIKSDPLAVTGRCGEVTTILRIF